MKIPETTTNGVYYGNEEGQWQGNGVLAESGAGAGDAHYATHVPAGYVMSAPYYQGGYPPVAQPDDFEEYMWMENEEEFDKQVMQQLEEEALMEQCIEAMLEDEQRERQKPANGDTSSDGAASLSLEEAVSRSTLNPLAAEFVPNRARPRLEDTQPVTEKTEVESSKEDTPPAEKKEQEKQMTSESKTEDTIPKLEPPEVSAADVQPIQESKSKPKQDLRKVKSDPKKSKPLPVKEKPAKRKETKKNETEDVLAVDVKQTIPPPEETSQTEFKPINYAAAAKANKPKKATTPPIIEKPAKVEKTEKTEKKTPVKDKKTEKPIAQRKNSAK